MIAGGGVRPGVVVGATNSRAEYPVEREVAPHDLLATVYRLLDIDPGIHFRTSPGALFHSWIALKEFGSC